MCAESRLNAAAVRDPRLLAALVLPASPYATIDGRFASDPAGGPHVASDPPAKAHAPVEDL